MRLSYAAELLLEEASLPDDFDSEDAEDDDDDVESEDVVDADDFDDDAGELLDEEPRLSLR